MVANLAEKVRCGLGEVYFGKRPGNYTGYSAEINEEEGRHVLRCFDESGAVEAPAEVLCCAGKILWDQGVRDLPMRIFDSVAGVDRLLLCSTCRETVTAVTVQVGKADFSPKNIPLRFEKPLINDALTLPGIKPFRLTALRFRTPYAVVFLETAGDCALLGQGREISGASVFAQGAEVVFAHVRGEGELRLRVFHRSGGGVRGDDLCAGLVAAVATGRCLPDRAVTVPLPSGEIRAVCTKEWEIFLTVPVA